jgi:lipocalin
MNKGSDDISKKYLLILPCSERKKLTVRDVAIDLYDGQFFRVLRNNMPTNLDVLILSAKYGLIKSDKRIEYYDQIMSTTRAQELAEAVKLKLSKILRENSYNCVFVNLGKTYILALEKSKEILDNHNVYWARGQIGERSHQLKEWLNAIRAKE